jgi:hypothetical protein
MGFLENLERETEEQNAAIKKKQQAECEQEKRKQEAEEQSIIDLKEGSKQRERLSEKYYKESGCNLLVERLGKIIGGGLKSQGLTSYYSKNYEHGNGNIYGYPDSKEIKDFDFDLRRVNKIRKSYREGLFRRKYYFDYEENGYGSFVVFLEWETDRKEAGYREEQWTAHCIAVETCPNGDICFYGDLIGSSVLEKNQWSGNKECLEERLEKAYNNPRITQKSYKDTSTYEFPN